MANPVISSVTFDKTAYNKGDIITCTVKYSDSNTHGVVNGLGALTPVGPLITSLGSSTVSVSPVSVGDLVLLHVVADGASPTGISGGNCTWVQVGTTFTGTVNAGFGGAVYAGTATATGAATATVTFSAPPAESGIAGQEYHSSTGQWVFVAQANLDSTGSNTLPVLNPTGPGQLYSAYPVCLSGGTAGQTPGYTYELDAFDNPYVFNPSCAQSPQAPTLGNSGANFGIAVLMSAPLSSGTFTAVGSLIQSLTDTVTVDPESVGDLVLLHVISLGDAPPASVAGGNCTWQQVGTTFTGTIQAGFVCAVYAGTAIATGSAAATASFTGSPTSIILLGQEYYSSTGQWQFISQGGLDSTDTDTMPTLNPTAPGQLYASASLDAITSTAGSTPGYTYQTDSNGNGYVYNPSCGTGPQTPVYGDANHGFGVSVLMSTGTPSSGGGTSPTPASSPLIVSIAAQAGTDPYGNPYPQGLNVETGVISGTTLSAGNTLMVDATGMSVFNGAPTPDNLQLSIGPGTGIVTKAPVIFNQFGGTPTANPNQGATAFSGHGDVQVVDGLDQQAYTTERRSIATGGDQNVTSTTFATFLRSTVAAGTSAREYRIHAEIFIAPNQTGGKAGLRWTGPGSTIGHLNFVYSSGAAVANTGALGNGTSSGGAIAMTMVNGQEMDVTIDGTIQVPAGTSGSFTLDAACGTSGDTFIVREFTSVDVMPV
jgi:hypothetical protein